MDKILTQTSTLENLNRLMTLANRMGWKTIVIGSEQVKLLDLLSYSSAVDNFNWRDIFPSLGLSFEIVEGDYLGIEP